jgi:flavin reductase (DIM6/NTAB) family NADH-FMN oxidoreductase RutF
MPVKDAPSPFSADQQLRSALRRLAKAVVVVTSASAGVRYAMTATAVSEVSLDPPSMLLCVNRTASMIEVLKAGAPFVLNILHPDHAGIARSCAGAAKGEARFSEGEWLATDLGVDRLADAQASIACANDVQIDYGSHTIFVGRVVEAFTNGEPNPLVYLDGRFTRTMTEVAAI